MKAAYVYLTATLDAATWGAELALGEGPGRIYMVEPTGPIADDPSLTDKKYPGNPTGSTLDGISYAEFGLTRLSKPVPFPGRFKFATYLAN